DDALAAGVQLDRRLRRRLRAARAGALDDRAPALDAEVRGPLARELLAQQQLERRVRGLVRVAARLVVLDAVRHAREEVALTREVEPELAALELDRRAA